MQKTFLCTLYLAALSLFLGCSPKKMPPQGEALLNIVNADHLSLVVYNQDSLSTYRQHGVQDLLALVEDEPQRLQGAVVADKMVGKAAAALMVVGGVKQVYTNLISTPAREMLEKAGIQVEATEEVEMILNRDKTGQCPMDKSLNDTDDPAECAAILKNR